MGSVQPTAIESLQQRRFWLMVGKRYAYKNGLTLLRALQRLDQNKEEPILVCAGGGPWRRQEQQWIRDTKTSNRLLQLAADDQQLAWLYSHAEAVVVPSIAEGFSLPLIEALACNTPVIASDLEAHREVAGSYAILLPALNADTWAQALEAATQSPPPPPKESLGTEAYNRLCFYYSHERMTSAHKAAYKALF
jgi:glycosyltransferase involved in cell wall biosynthesis